LCDPAIYTYENAPPPSLEGLRERYARLESRISPDGEEIWLNWVIRLPSSALIGYVQATLRPHGLAAIAYELHSDFWGQGLAHEAVQAMLGEVAQRYGVRHLLALLKRRNLRSRRLLDRLGFGLASADEHARRHIEVDEWLMQRELQAPTAPVPRA
jgi:RimJ/RimL family protein N-acetyltransferase